ncbi:MAG: SxtJ family membrane protein [Desulfomonilaceae bacterium]
MNIIQEIKDEIKAAHRAPTKKDLNILALLFLVLPVGIGAHLLYWKGSFNGYIWIAIGLVLFIARFVPHLFKKIYSVWVSFSVIIGYFVSRVLLTVIFLLVIAPTGVLMRIFGKDPMDRKLDPKGTSYWQKREPTEDDSVERYEKQF